MLATCAVFVLLFTFWRPMPDVVWRVTDPAAAAAFTALSFAGWAIVVLSSFQVSHFDLFGLRQVWHSFRGRAYEPTGFRERGLYRWVRHPLMLGFLLAFWAAPTMTVGHLFFAAMVTAYIRFGTWIEQRDLIAEHGARYLGYRSRVACIMPLPRRARAVESMGTTP